MSTLGCNRSKWSGLWVEGWCCGCRWIQSVPKCGKHLQTLRVCSSLESASLCLKPLKILPVLCFVHNWWLLHNILHILKIQGLIISNLFVIKQINFIFINSNLLLILCKLILPYKYISSIFLLIHHKSLL